MCPPQKSNFRWLDHRVPQPELWEINVCVIKWANQSMVFCYTSPRGLRQKYYLWHNTLIHKQKRIYNIFIRIQIFTWFKQSLFLNFYNYARPFSYCSWGSQGKNTEVVCQSLTYMQSASCKMPGWMKHKLESRLPGEILIISEMQMIPPLWQKAKN